MNGWRIALRIAVRDARRAPVRSLLVMVLIALPVAAVTAAAVLQSTVEVSAVEGLDRTLGPAAAQVRVDGVPTSAVAQDPEATTVVVTDEPLVDSPPTLETLPAALDGAPVVETTPTTVEVATGAGAAIVEATTVDLSDPLAAGLVELVSGRLPAASDEVVVDRSVLDLGVAVGDRLRLQAGSVSAPGAGAGAGGPGSDPVVVGVVEPSQPGELPVVLGPSGSLPAGPVDATATRTYLVGGPPVSWSRVLELNARGASVLSRAVVEDPPADAGLSPVLAGSTVVSSAGPPVGLLVVVMVVLEVVLLAGPAFAVGARRLQRTLALLTAAGGTPRQARGVVVGGALVLGALAAVVGVLLGVAAAAGLVPLLQARSSQPFGPFDVPVGTIVLVASLGLLSALLAAAAPARSASRQDVVAVLAGRRGDPAPSRRSPLVGALLLGAGVATAAVGATVGGGTEGLIAFSAVPTMIGMLLLVPVVVSSVARLAAPLPLSLRYAARDAARHRARTVPTVAAIAATTAGVVLLLISTTSDAAQARATFRPDAVIGTAGVEFFGGATPQQYDAAVATVRRVLPDAQVTPVDGLVYGPPPGTEELPPESASTVIGLEGADDPDVVDGPLDGIGGVLGTDFVVADRLPDGLAGVSAAERAAGDRALAAGRPVVLSDRDPGAQPQTQDLPFATSRTSDQTGGVSTTVQTLTCLVVDIGQAYGPSVVLPTAPDLGLGRVGRAGALVTGVDVTEQQEDAIDRAVAAIATDADGFSDISFVVARDYAAGDDSGLLQLVLLALGGALVLGGTITATFLALADARPDLATLAAVGASSRRRRSIAAGYALVVGLVGSVLGAVVGAVPGLAIAVPLTRPDDSTPPGGPGSYVDVPWLAVGVLVIGLPVLVAGLAALVSGSRLPLVARPD